jgi:lysine 2,3-aminomutase
MTTVVQLKSGETLRSPSELVARGLAPAADLATLQEVASRYAVAVTDAVVGLIDPADPDDPIARQYIPSAQELNVSAAERADPIGDAAHSPVAGIVHRHADRVLFKLVSVCAVYCRFCFRREMVGPGKDSALSPESYRVAIDYIRSHAEIWEVILTGGDPLMLSPRRLNEVMAALAAIDHVTIVRIHTRVPVVAPVRVTPRLIEALTRTGKSVYVSVHANHARELTAAARVGAASSRA